MKRLSKRFIVIALCALMTFVFASCTQPDNNPAGQQPEEDKPLISNDYFYGDWEVYQEDSYTHELEKIDTFIIRITKDDMLQIDTGNESNPRSLLASIITDPYATYIDRYVSFGYSAKYDAGNGEFKYSALSIITEGYDLIYKTKNMSNYSGWEANDPQVTTYTLKRIGETPSIE